jgi:hypothetical protein
MTVECGHDCNQWEQQQLCWVLYMHAICHVQVCCIRVYVCCIRAVQGVMHVLPHATGVCGGLGPRTHCYHIITRIHTTHSAASSIVIQGMMQLMVASFPSRLQCCLTSARVQGHQ